MPGEAALVRYEHIYSILDENQALRSRVALQAALIQRLLDAEAMHHQHSSGIARDGGSVSAKPDASHASPVLSDE
eukprot:6288896-Karenia_brevis.AAC.1